MPVLHTWQVICTSDHYTAPEVRVYRLTGYIYGDTRGLFPDGNRIRTTRIADVAFQSFKDFKSGDLVTTKSGSVYELGDPAETSFVSCYEDWIKQVPFPDVDPLKDERLGLISDARPVEYTSLERRLSAVVSKFIDLSVTEPEIAAILADFDITVLESIQVLNTPVGVSV